MKRMHVNLAVTDLEASMRFYSSLFATAPTVVKHDYAKWMLDDPRVNFAITTRGDRKGIDHLGIQVESDGELQDVYDRLKKAGGPMIEQGETTCCYAHSEKSWIFDPEGIAWETFFTKGESTTFGEASEIAPAEPGRPSACCARPDADAPVAAVSCCDASTKETVKAKTGCCA